MKTSFIYVSDTSAGTITKFHEDGTSIVVAKNLNQPAAPALDRRGNLLYAAVSGTGTVEKFDLNGNHSSFATGLNKPAGLVMDRCGNLFVANAGNGTIVKVDSGGHSSIFASELSLTNPYLAFDADEYLYASTTRTIEKFTSDGAHTTILSVQNFVYGLAFDGCSRLFVSLQNAGSIKGLPGNGLLSSDNPLTFCPAGIASDSGQGCLYVALGQSIRRYRLDGCGAVFATGFANAQYLAVFP